MIELSTHEAVVELRNCTQWEDCAELDHEVEKLLQGGYPTIILDMSELRTITPLTISRVLELWEKLWERGRELLIKGCNEEIRSTFHFLRMDRYMHFLP